MSGPVGARTQKVSGSSSGSKADFKKSGYAGTKPDPSAIGSKTGKTNKKGYSGPNVQQGSFD